ncbi:MAG TPA: hypothetical protein VLF40_04310 [Candidatus Saccharimonadales bacterium]|nr:hypothetical protein [Candidatus Saccharimonadales bacterium]
MAEALGKLDPEADMSMLTDFSTLTELEQAEATKAVSGCIAKMLAEARDGRVAEAGRYIVGFPDGRVTAMQYMYSTGTNEGEK